MKTITFIAFSFLFCLPSMAQTTIPVQYRHQLGLHAGSTTGIGLSYRYWPGKLGIQATLLPYKNNSDRNENTERQDFYQIAGIDIPRGQFVSIGLSGLLKIRQFNKSIMFTYLGNHFLLLRNKTSYSAGAGIGFAIDAPVSFNFMLGYGAYDITNSLVLFPAFEIGVYFRFKHKD